MIENISFVSLPYFFRERKAHGFSPIDDLESFISADVGSCWSNLDLEIIPVEEDKLPQYNHVKIWKKERNDMKGIQIGIVGICVSLAGIAAAMNDVIAICAASAGLLLSVAGCFIREK